MNNMQEFKADPVTMKFIYSFIVIPYTEYERFIIFPDGCDYIVISSKGHYQIYKKKTHFQSIQVEDESLFILRLKPYTLALFEEKEYIFKSQMINLANNIFTTKSILKQMDLTYEHILSDIYKLNNHFTKLSLAINTINDKKGEIDVSDLALQLDISIRTLQRWFKKDIHLAPKDYIAIIKIQADIRKIKKVEFFKTHNAPDFYTDYSHFYKKFKKFTNISPKVFYDSKLNHFSSVFDIY